MQHGNMNVKCGRMQHGNMNVKCGTMQHGNMNLKCGTMQHGNMNVKNRQCSTYVILRRVRLTFVAVEKK
jgi:hypothetical protein